MDRVRRSVSHALALIHAALDEMTEANIAAAKLHAADLLPQLRRLTLRSDAPSELMVQISELNAMLVVLRRRLDGRAREPN